MTLYLKVFLLELSCSYFLSCDHKNPHSVSHLNQSAACCGFPVGRSGSHHDVHSFILLIAIDPGVLFQFPEDFSDEVATFNVL